MRSAVSGVYLYSIVTFLAVFCLPVDTLKAQHLIYVPEPYSSCTPTWEEQLRQRTERCIADLPDTLSHKVRKDVEQALQDQRKDLLDDAKDSLFIFSGLLKDHVDGILRRLQAADPDVPRDIDLVITRFPWPNASNFGQGTIEFNIGLLERLENDAQIAMSLAHELAHQRMGHVGRRIIETNYKLHSKEFRKELSKAGHQVYGRNKRLTELLSGFASPLRRHSREHETEADSLALIWTVKAGYDPEQAVSLMDILDECDNERWKARFDLRKIFDRKSYPFQSEWEQFDGASSLGEFEQEENALDDSLKTHPDCMVRKRTLQRQSIVLPRTPHDHTEDGDCAAVQYASAAECVQTYLLADDYGRAMFLALCALNRDSTDLFMQGVVSCCFSGLYESARKRELGRVLHRCNRNYAENYNRLLALLNNMHQSDFGQLAIHYLDPWRATLTESEDLLHADYIAQRAMNHLPEAHSLALRYAASFPKGRFAKEMIP